MDDVLVIDDVISKSYQDHIENFVLHNPNFPWYFNPSITRPYDRNSNDANDSYGWLHTFIDIDSGNTSNVSDLFVPLAHEACSKAGLYCNRIYNARAFMLFPREQKTEDVWHIDIVDPHIVCLYYINDSSGPTVISSNMYDSNKNTSLTGDLPITAEVQPKKGRAVLFDGRRYHKANNPNSGRRAVLNFNVGEQ